VRKLLVDALRAFVALPDDDWQPHDWHIAMEAKRLAGEELARLDRAAARKPVRGSGLSMGKRAADGPTEATRIALADRSSGWCEITHAGCTGRGTEIHHRLMRSQGGGHDLENLILLCATAHRYVHDNPSYSYERGWLLHRVTA